MLVPLLIGLALGSDSETLVEQGTSIEWFGKSCDSGVFLGTADGTIHYIDSETGEVKWTLSTDGNVYGSSSSGGVSTFIPSLDGYLFSYNQYGFRRLPLPIRDLVYFSPFRTETGEVFTSGKTTSVYFLDSKGKVLTSYRSNTTIPAQSIQITDKDEISIVRVDYELNVFNTESEIVRFAEFDIYSECENKGSQQNFVNVTTTINGAVIISINGTVKSQLKINGLPTSVFGSNGIFDFSVKNNGLPFPRSNIQILELYSSFIAVPSRPLHIPSKYELLISGLPQLPGKVHEKSDDDFDDRKTFGPGFVDVERTFAQFKPLSNNIDPFRPANIMDGAFTFAYIPRFNRIQYISIGLCLFIIFITLQFIKISYNHLKQKSYLIQIDPNDINKGIFNNTECALIHLPKCDTTLIQEISLINGIPKIKAIDELDNEVIIAYQTFVRYSFDSNSFNPITFLKSVCEILQVLFKNGFTHGSIRQEHIYIQNSSLLLGGYQTTFKKTTDHSDQANDIRSLAHIILDVLHHDIQDCFLSDLLSEMLNDDDDEVPTPTEILHHPLFFTPKQKIDIYKRASDFLHKPDSNCAKLFESAFHDIVGGWWTQKIDIFLLSDASQRVVYSGDSLCDLIRLIRNKHEHPPDSLSDEEKERSIGKKDDDEKFFAYFHGLFPNLFLYTYYFLDKYDECTKEEKAE
ncbi:kinase-like domain-containing protein [Histomonas meleagridis]|uniref:kinase-like domain-containing protein n=1 Tax=Histomonas meleagridis TaxID=135588 RepID=UPI0035594749|nr:kinase-like domain-containing protein [Histomonas meleagridis]KAH0797628.1 kinase-like domain-containing protein [Histomonas meleagridis]